MKKKLAPLTFFFVVQLFQGRINGSNIDPVVTNSAMFTIGNLQAAALKIQGTSISGGNSTLIGANTNDYYSQGNLMLMSTNILGKITLGGGLSISASSYNSVTRISSPLYGFKTMEQSLIDTSSSIGQIIPNGTAALSPNEDILLTGTDNELNVFQITNPNYYTSIQIDVPPKSTAIVNIMGEKLFLMQNNFNSLKNTTQNVDPSLVLFNFPQAKSITLNSGTISGTLLAPLAITSISTSKITGGLITKNLIIKSSNLVGIGYKGYTEKPIHVPEPRSMILTGISILTCIVIQALRFYQICSMV
jgi:choice-of-anchor A domain-containing protein